MYTDPCTWICCPAAPLPHLAKGQAGDVPRVDSPHPQPQLQAGGLRQRLRRAGHVDAAAAQGAGQGEHVVPQGTCRTRYSCAQPKAPG